SPPPLPVGVVLPARGPELARAHDLGADARLVLLGERVVGAGRAARASQDRGPEAGGDHPLVQPMAGVTEGRLERQALAGPETVQRYGEVVNAGPCHLLAPFDCCPRVETSARAGIHRSRWKLSRRDEFRGPGRSTRAHTLRARDRRP